MWKAMCSAIVLSSFGVAANAQAPAQTPYGPDNGFFRPAPDPSLTAPRAPQNGAPAQPYLMPYVTLQQPMPMPQPSTLPMQSAASPVTPATVAVLPVPTNSPAAQASPAPTAATVSTAPAPNIPSASVERQMDRSVEEADRERARMLSTPPGVGAAFDGTTSAENR